MKQRGTPEHESFPKRRPFTEKKNKLNSVSGYKCIILSSNKDNEYLRKSRRFLRFLDTVGKVHYILITLISFSINESAKQQENLIYKSKVDCCHCGICF